MSILKKTSLALALLAAAGASSSVLAYSVTASGASPTFPVNVANVKVDTTGNVAFTTAEVVTYGIDSSDNIIGRTTGISVRITLDNGATFLTAPTINPGAAAPGWTASTTAGGAGSNFIVVSLSPPATPTVLTNGDLVTVSVPDISAVALRTVGSVVNAKFDIFDPVGGSTFNTQTVPFVKAADVLVSTISGGEVQKRIDVGTNSSYASKTAFSWNGSIGNGYDTNFDAGTLNQAVKPGVDYTFDPNDAFTTTVTLSNMGIFDGAPGDGTVYLAPYSCYNTPIATATQYNPAAGKVTFTYTYSQLAGGNAELCFAVPGDKVISATSVNTTSSFVQATTNVTSNTSSAAGLPLQYNGSVAYVPMFNPASNPNQQSFLRVTNAGNVDGIVHIVGTDDAGVAGAAEYTMTLAAGKSVQLNSSTLEGSLGAPTSGKWRLVVTGEFANMRVGAFIRNSSDGTVTDISGEVLDSDGIIQSFWTKSYNYD
jgi:hypothetical protein